MKALFLGSKPLGLRLFETLRDADRAVEWQVIHADDRRDPRSNLDAFRSAALAAGTSFSIAGTPAEANKAILGADADVVFACGWYSVLPKAVLDGVRLGCFGLHNSLLPKYRGWSPLVWSIINGDREVGATVFRFAEGVDDGDILDQVRIELDTTENVADALRRIEDEISQSLPAKWAAYLRREMALKRQPDSGATYCGRRTPEDGKIDWSMPAQKVHNFVRAQAFPYAGAFCALGNGKTAALQRTEVDPRLYLGTPGQILELRKEHAVVSCGGETALRVLEVWVDGFPVPVPSVMTTTTQRLG